MNQSALVSGRNNATSRPRRYLSNWLRWMTFWGLMVVACYYARYYPPAVDPQTVRLVMWLGKGIRISLRRESRPKDILRLICKCPLLDE